MSSGFRQCCSAGEKRTQLHETLILKGGGCEQPDNEVTYFEGKKRAIQAIRKDQCSANDDYHTLDRKGQGITNLTSICRGFKSPTSLCPCGMGEQTVKHVLQECPELCELRRKYWPNEVSFKQKLYRNREELKTMVKFIMDTNLVV
ncbi:hypothetical protein BsWGS_16038 [Bradybaena similaris]